MELIDYCKLYVSTGVWTDFIKIFSIQDGLEYDEINEICRNLGRPYPTWMTSTSKYVLRNLYSIKNEYLRGDSSILISEKWKIPRTTVQLYLGGLGILRNRSEAMSNALINNRIHISSTPIYYDINGKIICFKSSWELAYYQQLIDSKLTIEVEYESLSIPYKNSEGLTSNYVPDFRIRYPNRTILVEIKPSEFINEETVQLKAKSAIEYCQSNNLEFKFVTEEDIDFDNYPNWDDLNIKNPTEKCDPSFIDKLANGTYKYSDHPRYNGYSYEELMKFINSKDQYSVTITDVYNILSRNSLLNRLRDEAPEEEKDIRKWMCKYLKDESMNGPKFDQIKLEYQTSGIRDFGLKTLENIKLHLVKLNRVVRIGDLVNYLGYSRNKALLYVYESLRYDPYEIIEEVNRKFRQ